jgi:hypothetical protein
MRSDVIVIASIGLQDAAQMRLAEDDKVAHTLAPDRSDEPFGKAILPRRGWLSLLKTPKPKKSWSFSAFRVLSRGNGRAQHDPLVDAIRPVRVLKIDTHLI